MELHYNAFISYRHHPDDIRVAKQIHQRLERFKIPGSVKKQGRSITRLFRDKEELPITSHLTDDINRALENSDFLIVICSPHTKESLWVQREIDTFLATHDRSRVLTVLASGEPYEVIPQCLLYEDVTDPVTGVTQRRQIEPLSCDWRMKQSKAVREELPRLAAALLGCGYDELRQRQRQYRMRRTVALFSAALAVSLCLTGYFISTSIRIQKANDQLVDANEQIRKANVEIQENLDQALQNQSAYLASASTERMEAGDRLTAIALAMAALPSEDDPRPYVPAAELALNQALNAYLSTDTISAQGSFSADALVQSFRLSQDGSLIYILDARGMVTVWDTQSFQKLASIDVSQYSVSELFLTASGNIVFISGSLEKSAICYSKEGTKLWDVPTCLDLAFTDDGKSVILLQHDYAQLSRLLFLDPDTGLENRTPFDLPVLEDGAAVASFFQLEYYADQPITLKYSGSGKQSVCLADLQTGQLSALLSVTTGLSGVAQFLDSVSIDRDGTVLIARGDQSGIYNGTYATFEISGPDRADILCYDGRTLEMKWQSEIVSYIYGSSGIYPIPGSTQVLIQSGNTFQLYDKTTGKLLSQQQTPAVPVSVTVDETTASGILRNGAMFSFAHGDSQCSSLSILDSTVDRAAVNKGVFIHIPLSTQVTVYRSIRDEGATAIDCPDSLNASYRLVCGDSLMIWNSNTVYMLDMAEQNLRWKQELGYGYKILGFSQDGTKLWLWSNYDKKALCFDTGDGTQTEIAVEMKLGDSYTALESDLFFHQDRLYYILECDGAAQLRQVDLVSGAEILQVSVPAFASETMNYGTNTKFLAVSGDVAWVWKDQEKVCVLDLNTGSVQEILTQITAQPVCTDDGDMLLMAAGNRLILSRWDGTIQLSVDLGEKKGISVCTYEHQLLVLCDDGVVYRYDRNGQCLSQSLLELYNTFFSNAAYPLDEPLDIFWCFTPDGDLILNAFGAGNIITCDSWQSRAFIPNLCVYLPHRDEIVCLSNQQLFVYHRYTTREQLSKAKDALGSFQLTLEQQQYYGIS